MPITIIGSGHFLPGEPITNDDLSRVMQTSDEWIRPRTGIAQRHFAREGEGVSDLGVEAAKRAVENAGIAAEEIDFIIFATMTPEHVYPGSGCLLGAKLGIPRVPALDIRQQCAAMPYAFQLAEGLVASRAAKTVLVVGADAHAGMMPWEDWDVLRGESDREVSEEAYEKATRHRGVSVLFGDGASALVLREAPEGRGLLGTQLHSDGRSYEHIYVPGGMFTKLPYAHPSVYESESYLPVMKGRDLFKSAVTELTRTVRGILDEHDVDASTVDWYIAHQANDRINNAVRNALGVEAEKVPSNIERLGNTSAATIGILIDEMRRDGRLQEGQLLCFLALGAGLNWGAALMRL